MLLTFYYVRSTKTSEMRILNQKISRLLSLVGRRSARAFDFETRRESAAARATRPYSRTRCAPDSPAPRAATFFSSRATLGFSCVHACILFTATCVTRVRARRYYYYVGHVFLPRRDGAPVAHTNTNIRARTHTHPHIRTFIHSCMYVHCKSCFVSERVVQSQYIHVYIIYTYLCCVKYLCIYIYIYIFRNRRYTVVYVVMCVVNRVRRINYTPYMTFFWVTAPNRQPLEYRAYRTRWSVGAYPRRDGVGNSEIFQTR